MLGASPGNPLFLRGMGLCQPLDQLVLTFEVQPSGSPTLPLSGSLTLGPECGRFAETLKEARSAPFVKKCPQTPLRR